LRKKDGDVGGNTQASLVGWPSLSLEHHEHGIKLFTNMIEQGGLPSLKHLSLCDIPFQPNETLEFVRVCREEKVLQNLEKLNLIANRMTDGGLQALAELFSLKHVFPKLRVLSIYENPVVHRQGVKEGWPAFITTCLRARTVFPRLNRICLQSCHVGDEGMICFANELGAGAMKELLIVELPNNSIGDAGINALAAACTKGALKKCTTLDLIPNPISVEGVDALIEACQSGALERCRRLDVEHNPPTAGTRRRLQKAIKDRWLHHEFFRSHVHDIDDLICANLGWSDAGVISLADAIEYASREGALTQCKRFSVGKNGFGLAGMIALSNIFARGALPNCVILDLKQNAIGDGAIVRFAEACSQGALKECKFINLHTNQIHARGIHVLARAMWCEHTLPKCKKIDLRDNPTDTDGTIFFPGRTELLW
jgi:uncharacterized Fe-S cluster protein YjdI